jgi:cephalosporin-C deacetylase-like acetyl esterase
MIVRGTGAQPTSTSFLEFVRRETRASHSGDRAPKTVRQWTERKKQIRERLAEAYGEFPAQPCELDPRVLGATEREGYRIEQVIFQSRPATWVTANAYVPTASAGKRPAVLSVHGHWPWARVDPVPHARAVGLVKLGYFVLAVDAFGAGERAIEPGRGTYHGALLGASTWPVGTPLLGLQIYDNMRAVDYMMSRPEVDGQKLAITGASGGGNQSMNAGAWDERFKAVVPVCSVGTYDAYLGAASCVCEVLPGGLSIAEEGEILALIAPRALMVINATRDAHQFSVGEAEKSIARARPIFELLGAADSLRHVAIDSGHDYNKPMREAMYGWLARWLMGEGDGSPISEPAITLEEVETLRCFPDAVRPQYFTLPHTFVHEQAKRKLQRIVRSDHRERWEADASLMKTRLEKDVFGGFPRSKPWSAEANDISQGPDTRQESFVLYPEPEMPVPCVLVRRKNLDGPLATAILIDPAGKDAMLNTRLAHQLLDSGWQLLALDLRATGQTAVKNERIRDAIDHNSTEWSIWMGRPLVGQWCWDVIRALDFLVSHDGVDARHLALVGSGAGGLVAICAAALDERVRSVATSGLLASFVSAAPPQDHRMATFVPFILDVGDVPHLSALLAPRRLIIARPVDAQNQTLDGDAVARSFGATQDAYRWYSATSELRIASSPLDDEIAKALRVV